MSDQPQTDHYLRINEIKNYCYCPRIPFYALCMGIDRETALSRMGIEREGQTKQRMKRRKHALHAVHDGARQMDVSVVHHELRLVGRIDEIVNTEEGVYVVDYKDTDRDYGYWRVQMLAYQRCLEAVGHKVLGCYVYTIPDQIYHLLKLTARDENRLKNILEVLWDMVEREVIPEPTTDLQRCRTCPYERLCNDVS